MVIFMERCRIFPMAKGVSQNIGRSTQLPILRATWEYILMEVFQGMPTMHRGHDSMFVVVDKFSKMRHYFPCRKSSEASYFVEIFFK